MKKMCISVAALLVAFSAPAAAQMVDDQVTQYVPDTELKQLDDEDRDGIDGTLSVAANVNLADNRSVVGQQDGLSTLFGLQLIGGLDYLYKRHEIRNTLTISESWARTPTIPQFVKNTDNVELESLYNYFLLSWFGPFARVAANTALFTTERVTADATNYSIARLDGGLDTVTTTELTLSDPFQPFSLYQSVGAFAEPVKSTPINLSARLGVGARETFAKGVLGVSDDEDTEDVVEVQELDNVFQLGAEAFVGLTGAFYDNRLTYSVGTSALLPFVTNDDTDRSATDLMRLALVAKATMSITEWASLNYQLRVLDDPQLVDELQVQNALLLTFQYTFIDRTGGKKGPSADEKLSIAEEKLQEAEANLEKLKEEAEQAREDAAAAKAAEEAERQAREDARREAAERKEQEEREQQEEQDAQDGDEEPADEDPADGEEGEPGDDAEPATGDAPAAGDAPATPEQPATP